MHLIVIIGILVLQNELQLVSGQDFGSFLAKYSDAIERYIMAGYGQSWKQCDRLSVGPSQHRMSDVNAKLHMDIETLENFDLSSTALSSSYCLLIVSSVRDKTTLYSLIQFGWKAIQHKRIGMVMSLGNKMTLKGLKNTTKLPFVIASKLGIAKEQFLCPVVGKLEPVLQSVMCEQSYTDYKRKHIRVGLWPYYTPYATFDEYGKPTGVDITFLELLQDKMEFKANSIISSPRDLYNMV